MALSTKPRVLFTNPPWWPGEGLAGVRAGSRWPFTYRARSTPGVRRLEDYTPAPFFMQYAASYVERATGARVQLRDSIATRESYDNYFAQFSANQYDFIFFESASPSWDHDRALIYCVRGLQPRAVIALAGPIATLGERLLSEAPIDAVIKGEYEKGSVRVLAGARGVLDFDLLSAEEMNAAPFPKHNLWTWNYYWDANPRGQQSPQLQTWASRGCPYKCIFCVWPAAMTGNDPDGLSKRTVRHYTADYLRAYFADVTRRYQFATVYFDDDTFNLGERHVLETCDVMAGVGLPWSAMCRADGISRAAWQEMKRTGCFGVKIGFESGNQQVVDRIVNKRLDLAAARDTVAFLHELGMTIHGTFTYGLPGETREQMRDTKRFIHELVKAGMSTYQESGCAEIEGAPLRTLAERGTLVAFPDARADAGYRPMANGAAKMQAIADGGVAVQDTVYAGNDIDGWMNDQELQWLYNHARHMDSVAEIGSFKGRSAHALASACPGIVTCVDHFDPEHLRPVHEDHVYRTFMENMAQFPNVRVVRKWSVEAAQEFPDGAFDMVFIDGHHTYESVVADIQAWRLKARRLLCGHDYCADWPGVIKAVDELVGPVELCNRIWALRLD